MKKFNNRITKEDEVALCIEWLNLQEKTRHPNENHSSYGYKHLVENWAENYISNDSFIEAVKRLGIKHEWTSEIDIAVALSERTVKKYRERVKATKHGFTRIAPLKRHAH